MGLWQLVRIHPGGGIGQSITIGIACPNTLLGNVLQGWFCVEGQPPKTIQSPSSSYGRWFYHLQWIL